MSSEKRTNNALDHSDHARRYAPSPLKSLQKYYGKAMISFAGGPFLLSSARPTTSHHLQACPVRNTSLSRQSLPTSPTPTRSHSTLREPHPRSSLPHRSGG